MARAIMISGDEVRFLQDAGIYGRYLTKETGVNSLAYWTALGSYPSVDALKLWLSVQLSVSDDEPLLLIYAGHGNEEGWNVRDGEDDVSYAWLVDTLARVPYPVLIVNDCCDSGSLVTFLQDRGVSEEQFGVIMSCAAGTDSYDGVLVELLPQIWRERDLFVPFTYVSVNDEYYAWAPIRYRNSNGELLVRPLMSLWQRCRYELAKARGQDACTVQANRWGAALDYHFWPRT